MSLRPPHGLLAGGCHLVSTVWRRTRSSSRSLSSSFPFPRECSMDQSVYLCSDRLFFSPCFKPFISNFSLTHLSLSSCLTLPCPAANFLLFLAPSTCLSKSEPPPTAPLSPQVWQHCDCMGVNSDVEHYLCEQCDPRPVDRVSRLCRHCDLQVGDLAHGLLSALLLVH